VPAPATVRQIEVEVGALKPLGFREIKRRLESVVSKKSARRNHVKFARVLGERTDTVIVPRKHEIPIGTLRSILNQAHINSDRGINSNRPITPHKRRFHRRPTRLGGSENFPTALMQSS